MYLTHNVFFALALLLFACAHSTSGRAQDGFSGGFRAGLNFSTFDGDQETDLDGMTLENFRRTTGFHVGATFAFAFTDLVGVKANLMYTQKGGEVLYEGPSYYYSYAPSDATLEERLVGDLQSERDVVNSYIDVPVLAYYRIGPVEIEGGVSAGFMVNSRASGSAIYTDLRNRDGRRLRDELVLNYDYNYFDKVVGGNAIVEPGTRPIDPTAQEPVLAPAVINAFYNAEDDTPLYRRLDFGLVGGASVYLNNGLFLGVRYQYGLTDTTRPDNDLQLFVGPNDAEREYRPDDKDYNRVIQASIGFRF